MFNMWLKVVFTFNCYKTRVLFYPSIGSLLPCHCIYCEGIDLRFLCCLWFFNRCNILHVCLIVIKFVDIIVDSKTAFELWYSFSNLKNFTIVICIVILFEMFLFQLLVLKYDCKYKDFCNNKYVNSGHVFVL